MITFLTGEGSSFFNQTVRYFEIEQQILPESPVLNIKNRNTKNINEPIKTTELYLNAKKIQQSAKRC